MTHKGQECETSETMNMKKLMDATAKVNENVLVSDKNIEELK